MRVFTQVQATVVGFLASIAAVIFGWIPEGHFRLGHAVLLCASSVATAFIASLLLGMVTIEDVRGVHRAKSCSSGIFLFLGKHVNHYTEMKHLSLTNAVVYGTLSLIFV